MTKDSLLWQPGESTAPLKDVLSRGGLLAFPTESSFGLGVDPRNPEAVEEVYRLKGRSGSKALPVVVSDFEALECLGIDLTLEMLKPLAEVWPAPLTAVLPTTMDLPAAAGTGSVAVRIPAHESLRQWLRDLGPLTATSANRSGQPPILTVSEAQALLMGRDARVIDAPPLPGGLPSTLIRWDGRRWEVLREGAFQISARDGLLLRPSS